MRLGPVILLAGLLPLTQGCIAAAIPVVAGAAMAKGRIEKASPSSASADSAPPARIASAADRSDRHLIATSLSALPAPDFVAKRDSNAIHAFGTYASEIADLAPGQGTRISALLIAPGELNAKRAVCGSHPLAVIVDLDPGRGTFDPLSPRTGRARARPGTHRSSCQECRGGLVQSAGRKLCRFHSCGSGGGRAGSHGHGYPGPYERHWRTQADPQGYDCEHALPRSPF